jgi:hypothetical protein
MTRTKNEQLRLFVIAAAAFGCSTASLGGTLAIFTVQPAIAPVISA